jgi:hypothetical protein
MVSILTFTSVLNALRTIALATAFMATTDSRSSTRARVTRPSFVRLNVAFDPSCEVTIQSPGGRQLLGGTNGTVALLLRQWEPIAVTQQPSDPKLKVAPVQLE